ncbi:MAG: cadherin domain-containing protein, partial [Prochloraceae cyanobacterium]
MTSDTLFLQPIFPAPDYSPNVVNANSSIVLKNYNQTPLGTLTEAQTKTLVEAGVAASIANGESIFSQEQESALALLLADTTGVGEDGTFVGSATSKTEAIGNFFVTAEEKLSFDFSIDLVLQAKEIENPDVEYNEANGRILFLLLDTTDVNNPKILDYFLLEGELISGEKIGELTFGKSDNFTITYHEQNTDIDGNNGTDYAASQITGTYQNTFSQNTNLTLVAINQNLIDFAGDILIGNLGEDVIYGTIWNDRLSGTDNDDKIYGSLGNDTLRGKRGDDLIEGGRGDDRLDGHRGDDTLVGSFGDDRLSGHRGDDILIGGSGDDRLSGHRGDDFLEGGEGDDVLAGHRGDDILLGDAGDDRLSGHRGDDVLIGGSGNDVLSGHRGDDFLEGGEGDDVLAGHRGDDILLGDAGNDTMIGGAGNDIAIFTSNYLSHQIIANNNETFAVIHTDNQNNSSTDILKGIEIVRFLDGDIVLRAKNEFPTNEGPTAISLSQTSVDENSAGAVVGTLYTRDPDGEDSFSYTLSDSSGQFEINGNTLKLKEGVALDFETRSHYSLTVTSRDIGGLTTSETFTITVNNLNEAPTAISLSQTNVDENKAGAVVGTLSTIDPDEEDSFSYTLNDSSGQFEISGNTLKLKEGVALDFETRSHYSLTVTSSDAGGLTTSETFTITVNNLNEAPTAISLSNLSVREN